MSCRGGAFGGVARATAPVMGGVDPPKAELSMSDPIDVCSVSLRPRAGVARPPRNALMDSWRQHVLPLSIVIVNWNGAELLPGCLRPLADCGVEVIVVDNGSTDTSLELLATSFPTVRVVSNPDNQGFAAASNQGLGLAQSPNVLFLNNDTVPDPAALEELAAFLTDHPDAGIAGPSLAFPGGRRQPSCGPGPNLWTEILARTLLHRALPGVREKAPDRTRRVDWVTGAALCIRRDLAVELRGLDEEMFMFYEDLDLCARARAAGRQVWFVATPPIVHLGGATRRRVEAQSLIHSYQSADLFFRRHGPPWRRELLRALTIPEMSLRMSIWGLLFLTRQRRGLARERLRAYRTILRLALPGRLPLVP
jgi:N-acetylglucosaminyl-diphospho-decaprenol L-rhamnosyltransferase